MRAERILEYVVVIFLAILLVCEGLLYIPGAKQHIGLTENLSMTDGAFQVNQTIDSTFQANLGISYYIVNGTSDYSKIYFYYDQNYPASESTIGNWYGLSQHLQSIIKSRNLGTSVVIVNATALKNFLLNPEQSKSVLVMASGVLPDTVYGKNLNLLEPWILNGGTLFWIGSKIGNLSGTMGTGYSEPKLITMGTNGSNAFVNMTYFGGNASYYANSSIISAHFGVSYKYALQNDAIRITTLSDGDGVVIGSTCANYTNVAVIHSGRGNIVYFSGPLVEDTIVSTVIINVLQSNLIHINEILFQRLVSLKSDLALAVNESYLLPSGYASSQYSAAVFTVQIDYLGTFAKYDSLGL